MNTEQKKVLRKIIYAVETGGQVYGKQDYKDFTEAYTNSSNEHAITIGAGQWYGPEAKTLLQRIKKASPAEWQRLDTAGVWGDVQKADWDTYNISSGSAKAKCIVSIISTATGIKCQDALLDEQMAAYVREAENLGVTDPAGQAMCANFRHQGGLSAVKRILAKTAEPYTLESLYRACQSDTGNQVGAYKARQRFVYDSLKKYFPKEGTNMANDKAINALIKIAEAEIGYLEKKSNSQLDSKTANVGSANYTKYWRDVKPEYQGQPWCAAFVSWCFEKAFGLETAKKLLKHWPYTYCPTLGDLFVKNANPKVGDIVIFYRGGEFAHTGIVTAVSGDRFETIEGNTSGASGIVANGGGVCKKSYYNSNLPGTKFCTPDYSIVKNTNTGSGATSQSADEKKMNTVAYVARMTKDCKCYVEPGGAQAKMFPVLKKDTVVDVMQYTKNGSAGKKWYFIRIPHPTEGFVFEFVPAGYFRQLK